jgi:steroid delta-isomerase-like uncharacterized protein
MTTGQQPTIQERNKDVLRKLADQFNKKDIKGFESVYSPNLVYHGTGELANASRQDFVQFMSAVFVAFPESEVTVDDLMPEGDKVSYRITIRGTHQAELMGIPATNKAINVRAVGIARVSGNQIVEEWENFDELGMMQQLGVMPSEH